MIRLARFEQSLFGSYRLRDEPGIERPLDLSLVGQRTSLVPGLSGAVDVRGSITARGLAEQRAVSGTIRFERWVPWAQRYDLGFDAEDGQTYRLVLQRRLELPDFLYSVSRIRGHIERGDGVRVATAELRVDLRRNIGRWLS